MYSYVILNFRVGLFSFIFLFGATFCCLFGTLYIPFFLGKGKWPKNGTSSSQTKVLIPLFCFFPFKNGKYKMQKKQKTTEDVPKPKNERKQTHYEILFYIRLHVTKVKKKSFCFIHCALLSIIVPGWKILEDKLCQAVRLLKQMRCQVFPMRAPVHADNLVWNCSCVHPGTALPRNIANVALIQRYTVSGVPRVIMTISSHISQKLAYLVFNGFPV